MTLAPPINACCAVTLGVAFPDDACASTKSLCAVSKTKEGGVLFRMSLAPPLNHVAQCPKQKRGLQHKLLVPSQVLSSVAQRGYVLCHGATFGSACRSSPTYLSARLLLTTSPFTNKMREMNPFFFRSVLCLILHNSAGGCANCPHFFSFVEIQSGTEQQLCANRDSLSLCVTGLPLLPTRRGLTGRQMFLVNS
jgi:hypothetical protein